MLKVTENMCDIRKTLHCIKQRVHHRCPPAGIQVSAEQIRLLAHQHVTDQPFSIRVVYRHLGDVYIVGLLCIVAQHIIQRLIEIGVFLLCARSP